MILFCLNFVCNNRMSLTIFITDILLLQTKFKQNNITILQVAIGKASLILFERFYSHFTGSSILIDFACLRLAEKLLVLMPRVYHAPPL